MTTIELTKSGIAMQKFRSDPQNALNERRKDVLTQVLAVGSVGRGKTFWIINLLRQLKEPKCVDRIFYINSTVSGNLKLLQDLGIIEYYIYDPNDPDSIANVYQKNMAPKKSKVKKDIAQPAKRIIERTICSHPMLKRVQKEVRELKKKSTKKYIKK